MCVQASETDRCMDADGTHGTVTKLSERARARVDLSPHLDLSLLLILHKPERNR